MNGQEHKQNISDNNKYFPKEMLLAGAASDNREGKSPAPDVNKQPNALSSFWEAPSLTAVQNEAAAAAQNLIRNFPRART
jgi:hypothetical protein